MPIPSYPENRREEYLNNIATGSGEIPPYPENREEQYLDAIAKNGGGGGSGGGVLVVRIDDDTGTLDKTWQEIHDALSAGQVVTVPFVESAGTTSAFIIGALITVEDKYAVYVGDLNTKAAEATSADGYPVVLDD